jgi:ribosomal protein S18 acetylase RimI-like enzyme
MTQDFSIRLAQKADISALSALKLACFRETFGPGGFDIPYPAKDLAIFEAESYGAATVERELADSARRTWVACDGDGGLVGYVHVGPGKLPHPDFVAGDGELYQLYLRGHAQGSGLGRRLMDLGLGYLEGWGRPIWLGVWQGNLRAQQVYAARGFAVVGEYQFAVGDWRDDEFIMRRG